MGTVGQVGTALRRMVILHPLGSTIAVSVRHLRSGYSASVDARDEAGLRTLTCVSTIGTGDADTPLVCDVRPRWPCLRPQEKR